MNANASMTMSARALLERLESELQTADGRTVKVCRDANGNFWVIDAAERVMPLSEFASDIAPHARGFCERERTQAMREIAASVKRAVARAMQSFRPAPKPAHA
jgi:hypothetical protein